MNTRLLPRALALLCALLLLAGCGQKGRLTLPDAPPPPPPPAATDG